MSTGILNPDKYAHLPGVKSPMWDLSLIPNLTGKIALVTGANSPQGIGFHTAHQLALSGAKVYIGSRTLSKAHSAIQEMLSISPSLSPSQLAPFVLDLSSLSSVALAASHLMASENRLDILVNNAGVIPEGHEKISDEILVSFVTNYLGSYLLTTKLLPLLEKTARTCEGVRVVMVTSRVHELVPRGTRFRRVEDFNAEMGGDNEGGILGRYGLSKLASILFAKSLNKHFVENGIAAVSLSLHPGGVRTAGGINFFGENHERLKVLMEPVDGAMTTLFAATRPEVWEKREKYGGAYLMPFDAIVEPSEDARDAGLAEELWGSSEAVIRGVLEGKVGGELV